ncbi:hypothetical protein DFP72DRAFT_862829 [Ephemerocybe angulata]|uniref:Uncharacterized protein n=1 Tax=Ephemerocybe angulata TaxID=980116 RepID=A0A8H6LUE6_9AGAR|nr:hypothetical protein DFP72DRAFT_862824 [Tulosesus angulatus]KAF6741227.1 hypothetical protein DFP72DRAFT_862829 [Tulosesus angulatus]
MLASDMSVTIDICQKEASTERRGSMFPMLGSSLPHISERTDPKQDEVSGAVISSFPNMSSVRSAPNPSQLPWHRPKICQAEWLNGQHIASAGSRHNLKLSMGLHPVMGRTVAYNSSSDHPLASGGGFTVQFDDTDFGDNASSNDGSTSTGAMDPRDSVGGHESDVGSPSGSEGSVLAASGSIESLDNMHDRDVKEFLENMPKLLAINKRHPEIVRSMGAFLVLTRPVLGHDSESVPDSFWEVTERVSKGHRSLLPLPIIPDPTTIPHFQRISRPNSTDLGGLPGQDSDLLSPIHASTALHALESPSPAPTNNPTLSAIPSTPSSHMDSSTSTSSLSAPSPLAIDDSQQPPLAIDGSQQPPLVIDGTQQPPLVIDGTQQPPPVDGSLQPPNRLPAEKVRRRNTSLIVATGVDAVEALVVPPGGSSPCAVSGNGLVQRSANGTSPRLPMIAPHGELDPVEIMKECSTVSDV